jgi:hypothetical protein
MCVKWYGFGFGEVEEMVTQEGGGRESISTAVQGLGQH